MNAVELLLTARAPRDRDHDAPRARHDVDVADVRVEIERAARRDVEVAADGTVDRGVSRNGQEPEDCGGKSRADALHGRPPTAQYARERERLANGTYGTHGTHGTNGFP